MQKALDIFQEITQALLTDEQQNPVARYIPSDKVYEELDLGLSYDGTDMDQFKKSLKDLVLATPRTATNAFFNQLFGGRNATAVLGDLLAVILNNSMYTYKAGGPMIAIEKEIIRNITDLLGWDNNADGTLAAGGSMTNFKGILMARDAYDPEVRHKGGRADLVVYTSEESHYSIPKNAAFAGIGQVYKETMDFHLNQFHYNYGGGIRFQIHKESQANIRFDYGRTKDSHGFYIVFGECF